MTDTPRASIVARSSLIFHTKGKWADILRQCKALDSEEALLLPNLTKSQRDTLATILSRKVAGKFALGKLADNAGYAITRKT